MQSEQAFRELQRDRTRLRFANAVRQLWGERTFLVRLSLLGSLLGILAAFLIPARYTSSVRLMPPNNQSGSALAMVAASMASTPGADMAAGFAGDLLSHRSSSDALMAILRSRTLSDQVIQRFDLLRVYGATRMREARDRLANSVSVSLDRKDETITITVTDYSPERARDIAGAYVDQLNRLVAELSTSAARRERIFLENRLSQVNLELQDAEKAFSQFASKNSAVDIKEQAKAMLGAAAVLQGQLISAQSELEGMRQIYADSHVRVRSLKARIAELQRKLEELGGKEGPASVGASAATADLYPPIRKLPLLGATYADLFRRTKVQESVYQILTQEYELAKVEEAREIPTVRVLDAPDLPDVKSFPPRSLIAGSGLCIAFAGGMAFLLLSKSWNDKNPHDLSKAVVAEIWIDLKEKRFLNPSQSFRGNHSFSSILGLSDDRNGASATVYPQQEDSQTKQVKQRSPAGSVLQERKSF